ncbi:hypothetical protein [Acetobacter pasteurianus]|uniref:hypothetical protein n=1 Tax=Acetobacter pasteurianus TaxID=438 RepID=UPI001363317E|nr:hypothetical protein [Acetobacter pasteurianus]QHM90382.1 hypothetical protein FCN51_01965 [Acetobacter pasteurianus]
MPDTIKDDTIFHQLDALSIKLQALSIMRLLDGTLSDAGKTSIIANALEQAENSGRKSAIAELEQNGSRNVNGGIDRLDQAELSALLRQAHFKRDLDMILAIGLCMKRKKMKIEKPNPFRMQSRQKTEQ